MSLTLLLAIIIIAVCVLLLGVRVFFVKGGEFPNTHVSGNKALGEKGISCSKTQDRTERNRKNLFERMEEEKKENDSDLI